MEKLRVVEKTILDTFLFNILSSDLVRDLFRSTIKKLVMLNQTKKNKLIIFFIFRIESLLKELGLPSALILFIIGSTLSIDLINAEKHLSRESSILIDTIN